MPDPTPADFPVTVQIDVAWGDMDSFAHVNNVVYFRYFEHARVALLDRVGWFASIPTLGVGPIVASTQARFRLPLRYPDRVTVGARVAELLADRATVEHRLWSDALGGRVATEGQAVVVSYDYRAAGKCPIPDGVRAGLEKMRVM